MPKQALAVSKNVKTSTRANALESNDRREMVAREAYLRAEQRGFTGGDPVQDWLEAEKKVNEMLKLNS